MVGYNRESASNIELTSAEYSEAGMASGIATRMIIQPLDVIKIRFQLQEEPIGGLRSGKYTSMIQCIRLMTHEEGLRAFWKGHVPAQGLSAIYGLVQFSSFEWLSEEVGRRISTVDSNFFRSSSDFFCGGVAGCLAMTAAMPLDVIRTRLVAQGTTGATYSGMCHAFTHMWKTEGCRGFFHGWSPSVIQIAPFTGIQFAMYNVCADLFDNLAPRHESIRALVCGAISGTIAKTVLYPLDMVRHRVQMTGFARNGFGQASSYEKGVMYTIRHIVQNETMWGLFKGLLISCQATCFTCAKLVYGVLSDYVSSVFLLFSGLVGIAVTMFVLGTADEFGDLILCLILLGSLQGAGWTPATRLVRKWFSGGSFGVFFSLLGCGSSIAGILLPTINLFYWRTLCSVASISIVIFSIVGFMVLKTDNVRPVTSTKEETEAGLLTVVRSKVIWGIALSYIFTLEVRTVAETWIPIFVAESGSDSGTYLIFYEVGGLSGTLISGFVLDKMTSVFGVDESRWRLGAIFSCAMLITTAFSTATFNTSIIGFTCGFFVNASLNIWSMIAAEAGLSHISGATAAFISFVANFGPILAGAPMAYMVSIYGFSCFLPVFGIQVIILLLIFSLKIPIRMKSLVKSD